MTRSTQVLLVLLRLVIGWHFLFEGLEKLKTHELALISGSDAKKPWSSEVYLREASTPSFVGQIFHRLPGDPLLERLTVESLGDKDPAKTPPHEQFPLSLDKDWKAYYERFVQYYELTDEQELPENNLNAYVTILLQNEPLTATACSSYFLTVPQRTRAEVALTQSKDQTVIWLLNGVKGVKRTSPSGSSIIEVDMKTPQRIEEYQAKVKKVQEIETIDIGLMGPAAYEKLTTAKADTNKVRAELKADLDEQTASMKKALQAILTSEQAAKGPVPGPDIRRWQDYSRLDWIDWLTRWGLTAVGICLLLGLFTRPACVAGAGFLFMFFLAMPPFPGLPENVRSEGHYLFINKNIIEMLALLALATTYSGRWAGLDGLFQFLNPRRWRGKPRTDVRVTGPAPSPSLLTRK